MAVSQVDNSEESDYVNCGNCGFPCFTSYPKCPVCGTTDIVTPREKTY